MTQSLFLNLLLSILLLSTVSSNILLIQLISYFANKNLSFFQKIIRLQDYLIIRLFYNLKHRTFFHTFSKLYAK
ncbi:hypothetical protein BpHYR1_039015 [Brachionus plicatilis]|uniref:Uncharacterized protein n=1 Tax=Brachionus plicatilis TaxID=10195 RepID=A0A3M7T198_BRAPC|nr:hypothetical protein BpHYR1_039015 [Brachionus plicatilis]